LSRDGFSPAFGSAFFLLIEQKALETLDELVALSDVPPLPLHLEQLGPDALVSFRRGRLPALVRPLQAGADVIAKSLEHHAPLCSSASHAPKEETVFGHCKGFYRQ
jgi:hypothetical protein